MVSSAIKMTHDDFDRYLKKRLAWLIADELLVIPGIYEILAEEFNNRVIEDWEADQKKEE